MAWLAKWLSTGLTVAILVEHVYIVLLEMRWWETRGPKAFGITPEFAAQTRALASNQGLYNGFLVVALALGLAWPEPQVASAFTVYGLACVLVAGIWGGMTANPRIFLVQALPALLALSAYALAG